MKTKVRIYPTKPQEGSNLLEKVKSELMGYHFKVLYGENSQNGLVVQRFKKLYGPDGIREFSPDALKITYPASVDGFLDVTIDGIDKSGIEAALDFIALSGRSYPVVIKPDRFIEGAEYVIEGKTERTAGICGEKKKVGYVTRGTVAEIDDMAVTLKNCEVRYDNTPPIKYEKIRLPLDSVLD